MIKNVDLVTIPVKDQKRALAFYTEKLGFTVFTDKPFNDQQRWIELKIGGAQTKVVLFTPPGQESRAGGFTGLTLACDDLDQTYEELVKRGVEFVSPPRKEPWGSMAMLKDSEGNQFVVSAK
ncbi:MAG TPA: VOC family protein [Myxococcales bacterium]|jgi:predicted enzyme related to lactoylglutathione lyase|nr:VOC family protein [Myxococcales bacterium]